jgi:hypothetical protein
MPYGVTEEMIESWGPAIFELSLNYQVRRGDAVRRLDFAAHADGRDGSGRSDREIARRVGLAEEQVCFIRNVIERRRYVASDYRKLFRLGGGHRWRPDQDDDPLQRLAVAKGAPRLRFHPRVAALALGQAQWTGETAAQLLSQWATQSPGEPALVIAGITENWSGLASRCRRLAHALKDRGIGRGTVVALQVESIADTAAAHLSLAILGAVTLPLAPGRAAAPLMAMAGAEFCLAPNNLVPSGNDAPLPELAAAAEPALLLGGGPWALHSGQSILANARAVVHIFGIGAGDRLAVRLAPADPRSLLGVWIALLCGASLVDSDPSVVLGGRRPGESPRLAIHDEKASGRCWGSHVAPALCLAAPGGALRPAAGVELRLAAGALQARGALLCGGQVPACAPMDEGWIDTGLRAVLAGEFVEPL